MNKAFVHFFSMDDWLQALYSAGKNDQDKCLLLSRKDPCFWGWFLIPVNGGTCIKVRT
jgi:hypothetical protein